MNAGERETCAACNVRIDAVAARLRLSALDRTRLGIPERIIAVNIPVVMDDGKVRIFEGYRVQYNGARGPYKGGIRYHAHIDRAEVTELAFLMTIKNALMNLPYGGAKGGVVVDPKMLSRRELERLTRGLARSLGKTVGPHTDVPAPDVNTDATVMDWFADEYGKQNGKREPAVVTGKSLARGGSRGRDVATGLGGVFVLERYMKEGGIEPKGTTVAIQGFGNVGGHIARLLAERGFRVVAVSNSKGGAYRESGFSARELAAAQKKRVLPEGEAVTQERLLTLPISVLIPAALSGQITRKNAGRIHARVVLEMANAPITPEGDALLARRGIPVIPDILANGGGVTVSYFEWLQNLKRERWSERKVCDELKERMDAAYAAVSRRAKKDRVSLRVAAYEIAVERIVKAMRQNQGPSQKRI